MVGAELALEQEFPGTAAVLEMPRPVPLCLPCGRGGKAGQKVGRSDSLGSQKRLFGEEVAEDP